MSETDMIFNHDVNAWTDTPKQLKACLRLCEAFVKLNDKLFVVSDFTEKNISVNQQTGEVKLQMNDAEEPPNPITQERAGKYVLGLEEVMDDTTASSRSCGYTLSVLLFEMLTGHSPFNGRHLMTKAFLTDNDMNEDGIFIFNPKDNSNAPVPGMQEELLRYWTALPEVVRDAFVKGLSKEEIVSPREWRRIIEELSEKMIVCPKCGNTMYRQESGKSICPNCGKMMDTARKLRDIRSDNIVPLYEGFELMTSNTGPAVGKVLLNKDMLMLKNLSRHEWNAQTPTGKEKIVASGEMMPLNEGIKVKIGTCDYVIE